MDHSFEGEQVISFHLPPDTPKPVLKFLGQLKETGERSFSKKVAQLFITGVNQALNGEKPMVTIPLPETLTPEQQDWFNHTITRQLLANWICQMTLNPAPIIHSSALDLPIKVSQPEAEQKEKVHPETVKHQKTENTLLDRVQPHKPIETNSENNHAGFHVTTSYHAKLVGFFIEDE